MATHTDSGRWRARLADRLYATGVALVCPPFEQRLAERKPALLGELRGTVLEIGPGTGPNLTYYAPGVSWIGVEPSRAMRSMLQRTAQHNGRAIGLCAGLAERLPFADASVDAVVSTLVLCSVANLPKALAEIRRVLRPGGRFVWIEHVAAPRGTRLRRLQSAIQPIWSVCAGGCRPDRETWAAITAAGFGQLHQEHFRLPFGLLSPHIGVMSPHIAGWGTRG